MELVALALAYLLGAVPFGLVLTTLYGPDDVDLRSAGSGNIGATNVARVAGGRLAAAVLAFDAAKGFLPTLAAPWLGPGGVAFASLVGLAAFVGHCWPVYLEFRGGKGVATGAGVMLALAPLPTVIAAAVWAALVAATGRASVASLGAAAVLLAAVALFAPPALPAMVVLAAGLVVTHVPNLRRLAAGEEARVRVGAREVGAEEALRTGPSGGAPAEW
jgi:glycerol-3-phosphate acyltransferase PlsY